MCEHEAKPCPGRSCRCECMSCMFDDSEEDEVAGNIKVLDGATLEDLGSGVYELRQTFSFSDEEVMGDVAKKMIGPAGTAKLISVGYDEEGDQWPTAVYRGKKKSLEALHAIASGSAMGRPKRKESTFSSLVVSEGVEPDFDEPRKEG